MRRVVAILAAMLLAPAAPAAGPLPPSGDPAGVDLGWSNEASPAGGTLWHVAASGERMLAVAAQGVVYRSADAGSRWSLVTGLPEGLTAQHAAIDHAEPLTAYVAGTGGAARTRDGGLTWERVVEARSSDRVAVSPTGRVALHVKDADFHNHLWVSDDRGATWTDLGAPILQFLSVFGLAFGRTDDEVLVSILGQTYATQDGGATWVLGGGARALSRGDDGAVWRPAQNGLFRTDDGGVTWQQAALPGNIRAAAARPGGAFAVTDGAGLLRSDDGGATWTALGFPEVAFGATGLLTDPADPGAVFLTHEGMGVLRFAPAGDGYAMEDRSRGMKPVDLLAVARSADGALTLTSGPLGIWASRDGGERWGHTAAGIGYMGVFALAVAADGSAAYAGGQTRFFFPVVFASRDGGRTFQVTGLDAGGDGNVLGMAVDDRDPLRAWAAVWMELTTSKVFETRDGGLTWQLVLEVPRPVLVLGAAWHAPTRTLLVATSAGVLARDDPTGQWTVRGPGMPVAAVPGAAWAVASGGGRAYAGGPGLPLWRSPPLLDVLLPWAQPGGEVRALAAPAGEGGDAWAALADGSLARCGDVAAGAACADASPPEGRVRGAAVSPSGDRVFAASTGAGLWTAALREAGLAATTPS